MEYRILPHGGEKIGVLGLGTSVLAEAGEVAAARTFAAAFENGINYVDLAGGHTALFPGLGRALKSAVAGGRDELYFQMHFGANYLAGSEYAFSLDLDTVKRSVAWQLEQTGIEYIDFGFIHCLDSIADWNEYREGGILEYLQDMKRQGIVHHLGFSTHTPEVANAVLDEGIIDMLMFSINPAYDYQQGDFGYGEVAQRQALYRRCKAEGVGISVMKAFGAGQLLDAKLSPFKAALTRNQCIQYALDKPAVTTIVAGAKTPEEVHDLLAYFDSAPDERDYSVLSTFAPAEADGVCVYCNHCAPCPSGLNIGLINKYYDLVRAGDPMAQEHYRELDAHAGDCTSCGHCDNRCPFHVEQSARMQEIADYFGE